MTTELFEPVARWTAILSPCEDYRYELERVWDDSKPVLVVCMLNPSRADAKVNDPTVLALTHFATLWGYGGIRIVNLYAFRASQPKEMFNQPEGMRSGPDNWMHLQAAIEFAKTQGERLLVAWGRGGDVDGLDKWFANRAVSQGVTLLCLDRTKDGHPKHPMARGHHRIPRDQKPIPYMEAWTDGRVWL